MTLFISRAKNEHDKTEKNNKKTDGNHKIQLVIFLNFKIILTVCYHI